MAKIKKNSLRKRFDSLPSTVKVMIYNGVSTFLATLSILLIGDQDVSWQSFAIVPVGIAINIVAYLATQESKS